MKAFTEGDYAIETADGTAEVHVPQSIDISELSASVATLMATIQEAGRAASDLVAQIQAANDSKAA